mgnify:FL=1
MVGNGSGKLAGSGMNHLVSTSEPGEKEERRYRRYLINKPHY